MTRVPSHLPLILVIEKKSRPIYFVKVLVNEMNSEKNE